MPPKFKVGDIVNYYKMNRNFCTIATIINITDNHYEIMWLNPYNNNHYAKLSTIVLDSYYNKLGNNLNTIKILYG